jgi:hypothetical protein
LPLLLKHRVDTHLVPCELCIRNSAIPEADRGVYMVDDDQSTWNDNMGPILSIIFNEPDLTEYKDNEYIQLKDLPAIMYWPPLVSENQWPYVILSNSGIVCFI